MILTHITLFNFIPGASLSTTPTPSVVDQSGAGNIDWLNVNAPRRRKKSKSTVIRFSDFDSQEAYAAALAAAAVPLNQVSAEPTVEASAADTEDDDFDDDDAILFAIMRMYH